MREGARGASWWWCVWRGRAARTCPDPSVRPVPERSRGGQVTPRDAPKQKEKKRQGDDSARAQCERIRSNGVRWTPSTEIYGRVPDARSGRRTDAGGPRLRRDGVRCRTSTRPGQDSSGRSSPHEGAPSESWPSRPHAYRAGRRAGARPGGTPRARGRGAVGIEHTHVSTGRDGGRGARAPRPPDGRTTGGTVLGTVLVDATKTSRRSSRPG